MRRNALTLIPFAGILLAGCFFGGGTQRCHKPQEYQSSRSIEPIDIPEGLNAPDESTKLVIPPGDLQRQPVPKGEPCLEKPPDYFATDAD